MNPLGISCFLLLQFYCGHLVTEDDYRPITKWPSGKFGLPYSQSGCPDSTDFNFEYGKRMFHVHGEDSNSISNKYQDLSFCTKNVELNDTSVTGGDWPSGQYCFYRVGGSCPENFHDGYIIWQDQRIENRNEESGVLPDGEFTTYGKTTIYFCCVIDGDPNTAIELPHNKTFVLLKYGSQCQNINGTCYKEESVFWHNDRRDDNHTDGGVTPESGVTEFGDVKLDFCEYSKSTENTVTDEPDTCSITSYCVNITGEVYCGVKKGWTPRISKVGGWVALVTVTLYAFLMMCLLTGRGTTSSWQDIKNTYTANKKLVYTELPQEDNETATNEDNANTDRPAIEDAAKIALKYRRITIIPFYDKIYVTLPKRIALIIMVTSLICLPIFKITWDIIDVAADTYYFLQIETGSLMSQHITRNSHVNNGIMVFAVLGAVKSTVLGLLYLEIVQRNEREEVLHAGTVLVTQLVVCMKIVLEDGPEMVLEYFYLDHYITDSQPWLLVAKDVVTALIYILPLKKLVMSGWKDYKAIRDDVGWGPADARYMYIPAVIARALFSITMVTRVIGMVYQYSTAYIPRQCLEVTELGTLIQTPFAIGCMNAADWVIVVLLPVVLVIMVFVVAYFLIKACCC